MSTTKKAAAKRGKKGETFSAERSYARLTTGAAVRIARELQEMTQVQLAEAADVPQSAISAIENNKEPLGIERAKKLALALRVHPAVLAFPDWEVRSVRVVRVRPDARMVTVRERQRPAVKGSRSTRVKRSDDAIHA